MKKARLPPKLESISHKELLTVEEVSQYTGYSVKYLYKLCCERKIPHYNNPGGRKLFFKLKEIINWCTTIKKQTLKELHEL